jgi:hypothetical protein
MTKFVSEHSNYKGVIISRFNLQKVKKTLAVKSQALHEHIISQFTYIGEECVRIARESGSYNDITGNLRSSIGYVILQDGKPVVNGASKQYSGTKGNGEAGPAAAEALLTQLQAKFPWGFVLIVCAGMNYAAYVENVRHKDVLTTAELKAESLLKQLLNGIVQ